MAFTKNILPLTHPKLRSMIIQGLKNFLVTASSVIHNLFNSITMYLCRVTFGMIEGSYDMIFTQLNDNGRLYKQWDSSIWSFTLLQWFQSALWCVGFVQIHLHTTYGHFHKKQHQLQFTSTEQQKLGGGKESLQKIISLTRKESCQIQKIFCCFLMDCVNKTGPEKHLSGIPSTTNFVSEFN